MGEDTKKPEETQALLADHKPEGEDGKKSEVAAAVAPEIVLRVFMHCEGCARKVKKCLRGFDGVEDVITDRGESKVVVKGEKADPMKVMERIQKKSRRRVELVSPLPPPAAEEPKKPDETAEVVKPPEKTGEPPVITVVLGIYMHCEACAEEIQRRIKRLIGVESAEPDLRASQVTVKGAFLPEHLVDYVFRRTGKHAAIIKVEPEKKEESVQEEKKQENNEEEDPKKGEEAAPAPTPAPGEKNAASPGVPPATAMGQVDDSRMDMIKHDFHSYPPPYYQLYPQRYVQEMNRYPPQMFSDENPNACHIM